MKSQQTIEVTMAKKNFAEGIDAVLGGSQKQTPRKIFEKKIDEKEPEVKTSINMKANLLEKLRAMVFWERSTLKIELENAIELYLNSKGKDEVQKALEHFRNRKPNGKIKG